MVMSNPYVPTRLSTSKATEVLKESGITPTHQRIEIAALLLGQAQHCSAEQLISLLDADGASVSKATVYNTLKLFADANLVREVIVDPTRVFFDSNTVPHQHLFNVDTGELSDIAAAHLRVEGLPEPPPGTEIMDVEVIVRVRNRS